MNSECLLLRQVHPTWMKDDGSAASIAFWPFPKDKNKLSVDDGDRVSPMDSWTLFTSKTNCSSTGVWGFRVYDTIACGLSCHENPVDGNPFHALVDFSGITEKTQKAKAKMLAAKANARGCLFKPISAPPTKLA